MEFRRPEIQKHDEPAIKNQRDPETIVAGPRIRRSGIGGAEHPKALLSLR